MEFKIFLVKEGKEKEATKLYTTSDFLERRRYIFITPAERLVGIPDDQQTRIGGRVFVMNGRGLKVSYNPFTNSFDTVVAPDNGEVVEL